MALSTYFFSSVCSILVTFPKVDACKKKKKKKRKKEKKRKEKKSLVQIAFEKTRNPVSRKMNLSSH